MDATNYSLVARHFNTLFYISIAGVVDSGTLDLNVNAKERKCIAMLTLHIINYTIYEMPT